MTKALSFDLRVRAVAAAEAGMAHRAVAKRFGVSGASVSRWRAIAREQGAPVAMALGGDRRSGRVEKAAPAILSALEERPDITIDELVAVLSRQGLRFVSSSIGRFFKRHRITRKNVWPAPFARSWRVARLGLAQTCQA